MIKTNEELLASFTNFLGMEGIILCEHGRNDTLHYMRREPIELIQKFISLL